MLILSNCLSDRMDEGCLKVACNLIKRIVNASPNHTVITYERESSISSKHLSLNKFLLNRKLASIIKSKKEKVLYFPFPAKPIATAVRIFNLSRYAKNGLEVVLTLQTDMTGIAKLLLKMSRANLVVLSEDSYVRFQNIMGTNRVKYLKTGIDTSRFLPVNAIKARELKLKYGLNPERKVVLHVGHMNRGRNLASLMNLSADYQVVIVVSTLTKNEQDEQLKKQLQQCKNIRIIEEYVDNIEEIYQFSDVYFFPVIEYGKCIDVPLSCLEAASCNKPIVTTNYGEMKTFQGKAGFFFIESFEKDALDQLVDRALNATEVDTRNVIMSYDWEHAVNFFMRRNYDINKK